MTESAEASTVLRITLDTCALVPSLQRNLLLYCATIGLIRPSWSSETLRELERVLNELSQKNTGAPNTFGTVLARRIDRLFPDAKVHISEKELHRLGLNDKADRHVALAAIKSESQALVTYDRQAGFDSSPELKEANIATLYPGELVTILAENNPLAVATAVREVAESFKNLPMTERGFVSRLASADPTFEPIRRLL